MRDRVIAMFGGMGMLGIILVVLFILIIPFGIIIYGLYLAFSASILLGIIAFVVEPSPFVFGVAMLFGKNLPMIIQNWINFPI